MAKLIYRVDIGLKAVRDGRRVLMRGSEGSPRLERSIVLSVCGEGGRDAQTGYYQTPSISVDLMWSDALDSLTFYEDVIATPV